MLAVLSPAVIKVVILMNRRVYFNLFKSVLFFFFQAVPLLNLFNLFVFKFTKALQTKKYENSLK